MSETKISLRPNGPLVVEGSVRIIDVDGREFVAEGPKVFFCRCGASKTKPFCDGAHKSCGFSAAEPHKKA